MKNQPSKSDLNRSRLATDAVIREVTAEVMGKIKPDDFDTALVRKINSVCKECYDQFRSMHKIQVTPMRKTIAIEHIRKLYRDKLTTWTKDELLEAMCLVQATLGAEAFHSDLI